MDVAAAQPTRRIAGARSKRLMRAYGDDRLVALVRSGDAVAFEVLYDRHVRGLLAFCRHMLGSREEAEEVVQQTMVRAHAALQRDTREIALRAWLYTIARNLCVSALRARRPVVADDELDRTPSLSGLAEEVEQRADLRALVETSTGCRLTSAPHWSLGTGRSSHAEIGAVVGCPEAKVKALSSRRVPPDHRREARRRHARRSASRSRSSRAGRCDAPGCATTSRSVPGVRRSRPKSGLSGVRSPS